MSDIIKKLSNFEHSDSFIQIDTIKGFEYVNRVGEIINKYHKSDLSPPQYMGGLEGLIIHKPTEEIEEIRLGSQSLWAKFEKRDSMEMILNAFSKESEKVFNTLSVKHARRIGWRNYFFHEIGDDVKLKKYLEKFTPTKEMNPMGFIFRIETKEDFEANLGIQPVVKNGGEKKAFGILFDVDIFYVNKIETNKIKENLKAFSEYLRDKEGFLKVINNTF
ncbi:MAG: hypothetical protein OXN83_00390 [Oligoflexia bacterium]|nr:hypothetical protein [Oligoflexia bacterium]